MKLYLYKGGLHKITSVLRRWDVSRSAIPLGVFRRAIQKRTQALGSLEGADSQDKVPVSAVDDSIFRKRKRSAKEEADEDPPKHVKVELSGPEEEKPVEETLVEAAKKTNEISGASPSVLKPTDDERTKQSTEEDKAKQRLEEEKAKQRAIEEKARQRAELEEKLKTLTAEKHRYVLILKQILSTEEESKKRSMQSPAGVASSSSGVKPTPELLAVVPPPPPPPETKPPLHSPQCSKFQSSFYPPQELTATRLADLEEGELDCARTPSPRATGNNFSRQTQHGTSRLAYPSASSSGAGYRSGRIVKWDSDT